MTSLSPTMLLTSDVLLGLGVSALLFLYLITALLRPERF